MWILLHLHMGSLPICLSIASCIRSTLACFISWTGRVWHCFPNMSGLVGSWTPNCCLKCSLYGFGSGALRRASGLVFFPSLFPGTKRVLKACCRLNSGQQDQQPWKAFAGLYHHGFISSKTWGILWIAFKGLEQQNYDRVFDNVSECAGCCDATWEQITWACPDNWNHEFDFPVDAAARGYWKIPFRSRCKLVLGRGEPVSWLTRVWVKALFADVIFSPASNIDGWCEVFGALQVCCASFSWTTASDTLPPSSSKDPRNSCLLRILFPVMYLIWLWASSLLQIPYFPAKAYQEICFEMWTTRINARTYHAYLDEDAMGAVKAICRRTHRALMEVRVMGRILLGLKVSGSYVGVL